MKRSPTSLEEARQERLAAGRRSERWGRGLSLVGTGIGILICVVGVYFGATRFVSFSRWGLSGGDGSSAMMLPWESATEVFRQTAPNGPVVEARQISVGRGVPSAAEFRVDDVAAGTVFGTALVPIHLAGTRLSVVGDVLTIRLDAGNRPAQATVRSGRWVVRYVVDSGKDRGL